MANVLVVDEVIQGDREKRVRYKVTLSGNYAQAVRGNNTGEVLNLATATGANKPGQYFGYKGAARMYPIQGPAGYSVELLPGADGQHWLFKIFSAVGTELAAGAYPAAITADTDIYVEAVGRAID